MIKIFIAFIIASTLGKGETFFSPSYKVVEEKNFFVVWCKKDTRTKDKLFVAIWKNGEEKFYLRSEVSDFFKGKLMPLFVLPKSQFSKGESIRLQASSSSEMDVGSKSKTTRVLGGD